MVKRNDSSRSGNYPSTNVGNTERWVSLAAGAALAAASLGRGSPIARLGMGLAGTSLLARGATRFCALKAVANGDASIGEGLGEQWRRVRGSLMGGSGDTSSIETLDDLYVAELEELASAEGQVAELLPGLAEATTTTTLRAACETHARALEARVDLLQRLRREAQNGGRRMRHKDQAMDALVNEAEKMTQVADDGVRDAGLIASLQRLLHYRIAGYGTVAAYAKTLGRADVAAQLSEIVKQDKQFDEELSRIAETAANPATRGGQSYTQPAAGHA